ncbi:MAG: hypothetical protein JW982_08370 [Spirochaetes bacterium]|nr:hypothetical protein [Spirochaetota bacterium]
MINKILSGYNESENPGSTAFNISLFICDGLRNGSLSLYESYMLNYEFLRFNRLWYTQKAWEGWVQITNLIDILNQKLLAEVFNDKQCIKSIMDMAEEVFLLNSEKRKHYILNDYAAYLESQNNPVLLKKLMNIRSGCEKADHDEGPYHNESFPYDFFNFEEMLLHKEENSINSFNRILSHEVQKLIIDLNI